MVDNRLIALLEKMGKMPKLSYWELGNLFELPVEQIKKDILSLNEWLASRELETIELTETGYVISKELAISILDLSGNRSKTQISLSEGERCLLIYIYTFSRTEILSNFHYQYLLQISKNTVSTDIKKVNDFIQPKGVQIRYTRAKGYHIQGDEIVKRRIASHCIGELLNKPTGTWLLDYALQEKANNTLALEEKIMEYANEFKIKFVMDRLKNVTYLIRFLILRLQRVQGILSVDRSPLVLDSEAYVLSKQIIHEFYPRGLDKQEIYYLAILFLGIEEGNSANSNDIFVMLTNEIIDEMENIAVLKFNNRRELFKHLYAHLVPTFYRLVFGNTVQNDLTEYIKYTHSALYDLVKEALKPLERLAETKIPEEEIAYFVVHFGGQIEKQSEKRKRHRALIICPNGISSSLILKNELQQLFPQFEWLEHLSIQEMEKLEEDSYDLIFSTVYISTTKPLYIVKPIMDSVFKQFLLHKVSKDFHLVGYNHIEMDKVMATIKKYTTIHDEEKLKEELFIQLLPEKSSEEVNLPVLKEVITAERIQIYKGKALNWEEAINLSAKPLLTDGSIEPEYTEAIIKKVKDLGAFIDLGSGIAIPHARPEEGVNKLGMSILKLDKPVNLLEDEGHSVSVFICIAAIDNHTHLKALSQLTKLLMDKEKLNRLKTAETADEILTLIQEGGGEDD